MKTSGPTKHSQRTQDAKGAVKQKYPAAYAIRYEGPLPWVINSGHRTDHGWCYDRALTLGCKSQRAAWEAAKS